MLERRAPQQHSRHSRQRVLEVVAFDWANQWDAWRAELLGTGCRQSTTGQGLKMCSGCADIHMHIQHGTTKTLCACTDGRQSAIMCLKSVVLQGMQHMSPGLPKLEVAPTVDERRVVASSPTRSSSLAGATRNGGSCKPVSARRSKQPTHAKASTANTCGMPSTSVCTCYCQRHCPKSHGCTACPAAAPPCRAHGLLGLVGGVCAAYGSWACCLLASSLQLHISNPSQNWARKIVAAAQHRPARRKRSLCKTGLSLWACSAARAASSNSAARGRCRLATRDWKLWGSSMLMGHCLSGVSFSWKNRLLPKGLSVSPIRRDSARSASLRLGYLAPGAWHQAHGRPAMRHKSATRCRA